MDYDCCYKDKRILHIKTLDYLPLPKTTSQKDFNHYKPLPKLRPFNVRYILKLNKPL